VDVTLALAFGSVQEFQKGNVNSLEREVRKRAAKLFRQEKLIPKMIDRIKELLGVDDRGGNP
jgi:CRISPR-associated protein Cas1